MSITDAGALEKQCQERYGASAKIVVPRLLENSFTPFRVAVALGVYPNTIRYWLSTHGYQCIDGKWVKVSNETSET